MSDQRSGCLVFSTQNEFLAYSSPDGRLKIWETSTGILKQEYIPALHLSATCTCLSWSCSRYKTKPVRKKLRTRLKQESLTVDYIAMGTISGSVLIYSMVQANLHKQMSESHSGEVNCICWDEAADLIYSCSNDQYIAAWAIDTGKIKFKWKADRSPIYSICLTSDKKYLISGSRKIKWWNLNKQELIKTFTGHATEVVQLCTISMKEHENSSKPYFLSAALNDKILSAWQLDEAKERKSPEASFALSEEPLVINTFTTEVNDVVYVSAVTKFGRLHIFKQQFNGKCCVSSKPTFTVQIYSQANSHKAPKPLSILASSFCSGGKSILIVYGSFIKPRFEELIFDKLELETCLIRDDPSTMVVQKKKNVSNVMEPEVPQDAQYVEFNEIMHHRSKKDSATPSTSQEMSIEEKLKSFNICRTMDVTKNIPKANSLVILLKQGLQSNDDAILENVLHQNNETLVNNTVQKLPVHLVTLLLKEIGKRMVTKPHHNHTYSIWIKEILSNHLSFLITCPDTLNFLKTVYCPVNQRVRLFEKMSRLKGKLDLIVSQITRPATEETQEAENFFQIESESEVEDDEPVLEDVVLSHTESEDWDIRDDEGSDDTNENDSDDEDDNENDAEINDESEHGNEEDSESEDNKDMDDS